MEGPSALKTVCQLCPFHFGNWFDLKSQVCQVNMFQLLLWIFRVKGLKKKEKADLNLWRGTLNHLLRHSTYLWQKRPHSGILELWIPPIVSGWLQPYYCPERFLGVTPYHDQALINPFPKIGIANKAMQSAPQWASNLGRQTKHIETPE